jgi:hypothetical protein
MLVPPLCCTTLLSAADVAAFILFLRALAALILGLAGFRNRFASLVIPLQRMPLDFLRNEDTFFLG